jgi:hypothetical protein
MVKRRDLGVLLMCSLPAAWAWLLAAPAATPPVVVQEPANATEPAPPAGQTYIGTKNCSSCHFEQFGMWRQDKHAQAFEILPAKYKADPECLKCHTTGFGKETGFKTASDSHLAGTTCEACHGPGSQHKQICEAFTASKKLSPDQEKQARDSIWRVDPSNSCIHCHSRKAHKAHPDYDKQSP